MARSRHHRRHAGAGFAAQVRQTDTVARLGGDKFAVLLGHCPVTQALDIAEKLRAADAACYAAKLQGRHCVVLHEHPITPAPDELTANRLAH